MIPTDEVTFTEKLNPFCINCGCDNLKRNISDQPFFADNKNLFVVIPLECQDCGYAFSINLDIEPLAINK